jgi:two-component system, OmpR family, aerobic respiration control sensor histidine kinase ArcB
MQEELCKLREEVNFYKKELKSLREYHESILAQMPGHVYWLDRNHRYLGCNDNLARYLKFHSREAILGLSNHDFLLSSAAYDLDELNEDVMSTAIAHERIECHQDTMFFSQKTPLYDSTGNVIGIIGVSIDISELKRTEIALINAKEIAETANRAKTDFIANMSHDIRTPLSGLVGMSRFLMDDLVLPNHKQYARWINESAEQLLNLLNGIVELVSTEQVSEHMLRKEIFDLRQCIEDIVQLEMPTTCYKNIDFVVSIDPTIPQLVFSDRTKIHRVLLNLIGNAIKFTLEGQVSLNVGLIYATENKACLRFEVSDTGIGIPTEIQSKIFDRFFRAAPSYKGTYSGHGLGLHIAKSYVEALGGELFLRNAANFSTQFVFELLLDLPDSQANAARNQAAISDIDEEYLESPILIAPDNTSLVLLVEDNVIALRMVELLVTQLGFNFISVVNGEEALDLLQHKRFDLIITDIGLPGISGYELTRIIRQREICENKPEVPIIGLTAHTQAKAKEESLKAGMNYVFVKPVNAQKIKAVVSQYIFCKEEIHGANLGVNNQDLVDDSMILNLQNFAILSLDNLFEADTDSKILYEMLEFMFAHDLPKDKNTLLELKLDDNWHEIAKLVHRMKSGAIYCGAVRLHYACGYLEDYFKSGKTQLLHDLYYQVMQVMDATLVAIDEFLQSIKEET